MIKRSDALAGPTNKGAKCKAAYKVREITQNLKINKNHTKFRKIHTMPGCRPNLLNVKPIVAFVEAILISHPPTAMDLKKKKIFPMYLCT